MKYVLLAVLFLAGCDTMPSRPAWPDSPDVGQCEQLKDAAQSEKLSELLSVVATNYGKYHECSARVDAWQDWYNKQKKIYNESK